MLRAIVSLRRLSTCGAGRSATSAGQWCQSRRPGRSIGSWVAIVPIYRLGTWRGIIAGIAGGVALLRGRISIIGICAIVAGSSILTWILRLGALRKNRGDAQDQPNG